LARTLTEVMAQDLDHRLTYLGGSLIEHVEGGYEICLSPRLRARLSGRTHAAQSTQRISAEQITVGTPLTRAIHALYRQEVR